MGSRTVRSTDKVLEQWRLTVGRGHGGKATGQGKHRANDRALGSESDRRVERAGGCA